MTTSESQHPKVSYKNSRRSRSIVSGQSSHMVSGRQEAIKPKAAFLKSEHVLPVAHKRYIPPKPDDIQKLLLWSGLSQEAFATTAKVPLSQLRYWAASKTKRTIDPAVWTYLLIRLGITEQKEYRRVNPSESVNQTYPLNSGSITFQAKISFMNNELKINIKSDFQKEAFGELEFNVEMLEDGEIFIDSVAQNEGCSWVMDGADKAINPLLTLFLHDDVWEAAWRIVMFNLYKPENIFTPENLLQHTHKKFIAPTPFQLVRLMKWAGCTAADLAWIGGVTPVKMRYWTSRKAQEALDFSDEKLIENKLAKPTIKPHAWAIITSSLGLTLPIKLVGQVESKVKYTRKFVSKEVSGVPIEFENVSASFTWLTPEKDCLALMYQISTQKEKGKSERIIFKVTGSGELILLDGKEIFKDIPDSWKLMTKGFSELVAGYFDKALINNMWKYIKRSHL